MQAILYGLYCIILLCCVLFFLLLFFLRKKFLLVQRCVSDTGLLFVSGLSLCTHVYPLLQYWVSYSIFFHCLGYPEFMDSYFLANSNRTELIQLKTRSIYTDCDFDCGKNLCWSSFFDFEPTTWSRLTTPWISLPFYCLCYDCIHVKWSTFVSCNDYLGIDNYQLFVELITNGLDCFFNRHSSISASII